MNFKKAMMVTALILSQTAAVTPALADSTAGQIMPAAESDTAEHPYGMTQTNTLTLYMNSGKMEQDGAIYIASRPLAVKKGVSYASLRSLAERLGFKVSYNAKTKETLVSKNGVEARFTNGRAVYVVNGSKRWMKGATYNDKGAFMVPLTSITAALNIAYTVDQPGKKIILKLSTKPAAAFTVQPQIIYAGETYVQYRTQSSSPRGLPIVNERWEGREDQFQSPGTYPVTYAVQDSNGEWSDPYTVNVQVLQPNLPPVAFFETDKTEYKMGELITITDLSTDEENAIVDRQWVNNKLVYFQPGPVTIKLTVKDKRGATAEYQKEINITGETLYSEKEFYPLFTPIGENFVIDGAAVKTMASVPFMYTTEPYTLFRSSGPESVYQEGILYRDTFSGPTRFLLHHKSKIAQKVKLYLVARNVEDRPARLSIESAGTGGPSVFPEMAGQMASIRYFQSITQGNKAQEIILAPGETKVLFTEVSQTALRQNDIITFMGELTSDSLIQYTALMLNENGDPLTAVDTLPLLETSQSIVRGTFNDATRILNYNEPVGDTPVKIYLTDNAADPFQTGIDGIKGAPAINSGNYSVLYKLRLGKVAPNTLITFNPRGGLFRGGALVNGTVVGFSNIGTNAHNQNSVLYRTGNNEEFVEIWVTPVAGSNLPFCLLLTPLPPKQN